MKYRAMGRTGLRLSEISVGGWITFGGSIDEDSSRDIVRVAADSGINFIDLADVYALGNAERVAAPILRDYKRSDWVISSKVFWPMGDGPNDRGLSRKHIMESVEGSLKRLQTDYLDIYFCHRYDPEVPLDETVRAMDDLVHQGKILYWGTSVWEGEQLQAAATLADQRNFYAPMVEQPRYNLIDRHIESTILPTAKQHGMGVVVWSPLAQGMLTGKYNDGVPTGSRADTTDWLSEHMNDDNIERCRRFTELAREVEESPGSLALAWLLAQDGLTSVITGASHADQLRENVRAAEVELSAEVMKRIEEIFPA